MLNSLTALKVRANIRVKINLVFFIFYALMILSLINSLVNGYSNVYSFSLEDYTLFILAVGGIYIFLYSVVTAHIRVIETRNK